MLRLTDFDSDASREYEDDLYDSDASIVPRDGLPVTDSESLNSTVADNLDHDVDVVSETETGCSESVAVGLFESDTVGVLADGVSEPVGSLVPVAVHSGEGLSEGDLPLNVSVAVRELPPGPPAGSWPRPIVAVIRLTLRVAEASLDGVADVVFDSGFCSWPLAESVADRERASLGDHFVRLTDHDPCDSEARPDADRVT